MPALAHAAWLIAEGWIGAPEFPLVWRLRRERAGSGALGDLGSHLVDLPAPAPDRRAAHRGVDDAGDVRGRATAAGGVRLAFDFESMNELLLYGAADPETEAGFRRVLETEVERSAADSSRWTSIR
ncbi:hypothetical protein ABT404_26625 [Streptomyces hyaluromycini]|uniref:Uncharacterized protein n=1 Tax=Streptomyces hyaluromycini TaxID=1377993 RepID=A0ABV1X1X6_9ACTN